MFGTSRVNSRGYLHVCATVLRSLIFSTTVLIAGLLGSAQAAPPPLEHFARLPLIRDIEMSPGGKYIAVLQESQGRYYLIVLGKDENNQYKLIYAVNNKDKRLNWVRWVNDERFVMSVSFGANRSAREQSSARLIAANADGSNVIPLDNSSIIDYLDNDPEHVLISYGSRQGPEVYEVNIVDGSRTKVAKNKWGVAGWRTDIQHRVRLGSGYTERGKKFLRIKDTDKEIWRDLGHRLPDLGDDVRRFEVEGFAKDPNQLYVVSNHEAGEKSGLYLFDIKNDAFIETIYKSDDIDVGGMVTGSDRSKVLGVYHDTDRGQKVTWLDEEVKADVAHASSLLDKPLVELYRLSTDSRFGTIYGISDSEPTAVYIYDRKEKTMFQFGIQYPELASVQGAKMFSVKYKARDGLEIPSFITLPPGMTSLKEAKNLPFILFPHGGPQSSDSKTYSVWTQLLASRGYGILQMNFRGSTGYGLEFEEKGYKQWGLVMQDDKTDGAKWLIEKGYADPDRLGIMGISYGGYASLMATVKTPDLFQCAVSINGVSDLPYFVQWASRDRIGRLYVRHVGKVPKDREQLEQASPALHADKIQIPVLIIGSEDDEIVEVEQSRKMNSAMKRAKKEVTYIEYEEGGHSIVHAENRLAAMKAYTEFFEGCLN